MGDVNPITVRSCSDDCGFVTGLRARVAELEGEVERLTKERDEARRQVCTDPCCKSAAVFRDEAAAALARATAAEAREAVLLEALQDQRRRWESLPSGVDMTADEADTHPDDAFAWEAGLAVRAIDVALAREAKP